MKTLLDNIFWHALHGAQAKFAVGTDRARRFAPGFSPIVGFADQHNPDFDALLPYCAPGERFYCDGWAGAVPRGWRVDVESTMVKMIWAGALPDIDAAPDALPLRAGHASAAVALAELTHPGPFGPRTPELGDYFAIFEGERLVAMAGERACAETLREVSGICTHPEFQGRGLARRLTAKLVRRQLLRGETPFLHVMSANSGARALYRSMGFVDYRESVVRVVSRAE